MCMCLAFHGSTYLKFTIGTQLHTIFSYLSLLNLLSNFYMGLIIYFTNIYYGPWSLFDLRLNQAQLNLTKMLACYHDMSITNK